MRQLALGLDCDAARLRLTEAAQSSEGLEYINALLGHPCVVISGSQMVKWRKPAVYVWIRDDEILYVGKAATGISRPTSSSHNAIRTDAIDARDKIILWLCPDGSEALFEQHLIDCLKPSLNGGPARWAKTAFREFEDYYGKRNPGDLIARIATLQEEKKQLTAEIERVRTEGENERLRIINSSDGPTVAQLRNDLRVAHQSIDRLKKQVAELKAAISKSTGLGRFVLACSFCGKEQHEVRKLVAGPAVYICDECVQLCNNVVNEQ